MIINIKTPTRRMPSCSIILHFAHSASSRLTTLVSIALPKPLSHHFRHWQIFWFHSLHIISNTHFAWLCAVNRLQPSFFTTWWSAINVAQRLRLWYLANKIAPQRSPRPIRYPHSPALSYGHDFLLALTNKQHSLQCYLTGYNRQMSKFIQTLIIYKFVFNHRTYRSIDHEMRRQLRN